MHPHLRDIPFAEYVALDAVNWSTLKALRDSPLHYRHATTHARPDTASLMLGRAVHTATLEPSRFADAYAVFDGVRCGKEYDAFKASAGARTILNQREADLAIEIADAVQNHPLAAPYLVARGDAERSIVWNDSATGLRCKARPDLLVRTDDGLCLVDLKTTRTVDPRMFGGAAARLGYHCQLAMYADGLATIGLPVDKVVIIAVENTAPYDVGVFVLTDDVMQCGREEVYGSATETGLLPRLARYRELDIWPGRFSGEVELALPAWMFQDEDENNPAAFGLSNLE